MSSSISVLMLRKAVEEEEAKLGPGEKVSLEKIADIFQRISRSARSQLNQDQRTRDQDGEFNDFLEKRRPFLNPDN